MSDPTPRGDTSKQKWADPAIGQRIIEGQRRYWKDHPDARKQRGDAAKLALASPEVRQRISDGTKAGLADPKVLLKISENSKRAWDGNTKRREAASKLAKEILCNPEIVAQARAAHATPETSKAISEGNTKSWAQDPERKQSVSKWAKQLWAERRSKIGLALPQDCDDKPMLWRIIGAELLSQKGYMSNEDLALRLDTLTLECPYGKKGNKWTCYVETRAGLVFMNRIRNWVGKPGQIQK